MLTKEAATTLDFNETEIAEVQDAIDTLSPDVKEKFIGAMAVVEAVTSHIEVDALSEDINRKLLATRRFLAQADRRGYIHEDDRYLPLREKIATTVSSQSGLDDPESDPSVPGILFSLSSLTSSIVDNI